MLYSELTNCLQKRIVLFEEVIKVLLWAENTFFCIVHFHNNAIQS